MKISPQKILSSRGFDQYFADKTFKFPFTRICVRSFLLTLFLFVNMINFYKAIVLCISMPYKWSVLLQHSNLRLTIDFLGKWFNVSFSWE